MSSPTDRSASTIIEMLERADQEAPLLILPKRDVTYGEIVARSARLAAALARRGIARGDRVAILLPNGAAWFVATAACARLGVAFLSLNSRLGPKEIGDFLARARCTAIFFDSSLRKGAVMRALDEIPAEKLASVKLRVCCAVNGGTPDHIVPLAELEACNDVIPDQGMPEDPFFMAPTTGTTSLPKLVVHIQSRVVHHMEDVRVAFRLPTDGKMSLALPLCGGYGFTTSMLCISAGLPLMLFDSFDPTEIAATIAREKVTHTFGTNDMLAALLAATADPHPFPTLQMYGNANFTPGLTELPAEAERRRVPMVGMYGLTETLAYLAVQPLDGPIERRAEGGGHLVCPEAVYRVRHQETGALLSEAGEEGELEVLTPDVMIGYFEDPERTAASFTEDGYLRTGDIVRLLADGSFDFLSRTGDILRIGGYLVSPAEIEDVIMAAGPLAACQVVAITRDQRSRPVAFVVPQAQRIVSEQDLQVACTRELAIYKRPLRIFTLDALPVIDGPNGSKVQKHLLREMAASLLEQEPA